MAIPGWPGWPFQGFGAQGPGPGAQSPKLTSPGAPGSPRRPRAPHKKRQKRASPVTSAIQDHEPNLQAKVRGTRFKVQGPHEEHSMMRPPRGPGADFFKLAPGPILGPRGGQKWIPREISCRSHFFPKFFLRFFLKIVFFSNPGFFKIRIGKKNRFFEMLTSKKYGVNDPSGISHFCLSSKWHFPLFFVRVC